MSEGRESFGISDMSDDDIEAVMAALVDGRSRIQRLSLSSGGVVWIKRHGAGEGRFQRFALALMGCLLPVEFARPSPAGTGEEMVDREIRRIGEFSARGFFAPRIVYRSGATLVLGDSGTTVQRRLGQLSASPGAHDALLVRCAAELGRLHAAGLCHGRPAPRDMVLDGERVGFLDFEEEPQAVMRLEVAQARDLWLLFLQLATRAENGTETLDAAFSAWKAAAPEAAVRELGRMVGFLGRFLWLARLIGRVRMGSDLRRFIVATDYLADACATGPERSGKAGQE